MYLWNYRALALDFKNHKVTSKEKFKYLLTIMLYVPTGIMGSNWIPAVYRFIYKLTNLFLKWQAPPQVHQLKIYHDFNYILDIAIPIIIGCGVLLCYVVNRMGDGRSFIERFMCLSVPITIRISIYVLFLFLITLCSSLVYFNYKLQIISNLSGFLKVFKKLKQLKQLSIVMAFISHRMHILSCVLSLSSLVWMFTILYRQIKFIAH